MLVTRNFGLKYVMQNQMNADVLINENMLMTDLIMHASVFGFTKTVPQNSTNCQMYIVASGAEGEFDGGDNKIAIYFDTKGWVLIAPKNGMRIFNEADNLEYIFKNNTWSALGVVQTSSNAYQSITIGDIKHSCVNRGHQGWVLCDGSEVSRVIYKDLFDVIGVKFGNGDGVLTFNVPDARGKVLGSVGQGAIAKNSLTSREIGESVGSETHTLTEFELPPHAHGISWSESAHRGYALDGTGGMWRDGDKGRFTYTDTTGIGYPFNIMQPTLFIGNVFIYSGVV